jgi:hypothetical protein
MPLVSVCALHFVELGESSQQQGQHSRLYASEAASQAPASHVKLGKCSFPAQYSQVVGIALFTPFSVLPKSRESATRFSSCTVHLVPGACPDVYHWALGSLH